MLRNETLMKKQDIRDWALFVYLLAAFFALLFVFGIKLAPDSTAYISSSTAVSPLYPLLADVFELVFKEDRFVAALVVFQNILTSYAIFSLILCVQKRFKLSAVSGYILATGFILLYALQTVVTVQGRIPTNTVLSESLAFPLYFLYFKHLFLTVIERSPKRLTAAAALGFLTVTTRAQLVWIVVLLLAAAIAAVPSNQTQDKAIRRKAVVKKTCVITAGLALFLLMTLAATYTYNYVKRGKFVGNTLARPVVLTAMLYVSSPEDSALFGDGSMEREVFDTCLETMQEKQLMARYSEKGVLNEFYHYEKCCDTLQSEVKTCVSQEVSSGRTQTEADKAMTNMIFTLFCAHPEGFIRHYFINAYGGVVRSVSLLTPALALYADIIYIVCICWLIVMRRRGAQPQARLFMTLTLASIALNALFMSWGVWCLSRYMFYNFPIFYIGLYLLMVTSYRELKSRDKGGASAISDAKMS